MKEQFVTIKDKRVIERVDLPDGRYFAKIERKDKRTSQQNRYMHLMFSMIQKGFYEIGYREVKTTDQAKYIMKEMFLNYEVENGTGGKIKMVRRTRDLTKEQMADFIDECIQFAAENLSIVIPSPGEQTKIWTA
jgi:thioredoxin-related protein